MVAMLWLGSFCCLALAAFLGRSQAQDAIIIRR